MYTINDWDQILHFLKESEAEVAQLGERETEDLKVAGSIPALGRFFQPVNWYSRWNFVFLFGL